jgi:hypothetical protein
LPEASSSSTSRASGTPRPRRTRPLRPRRCGSPAPRRPGQPLQQVTTCAGSHRREDGVVVLEHRQDEIPTSGPVLGTCCPQPDPRPVPHGLLRHRRPVGGVGLRNDRQLARRREQRPLRHSRSRRRSGPRRDRRSDPRGAPGPELRMTAADESAHAIQRSRSDKLAEATCLLGLRGHCPTTTGRTVMPSRCRRASADDARRP